MNLRELNMIKVLAEENTEINKEEINNESKEKRIQELVKELNEEILRSDTIDIVKGNKRIHNQFKELMINIIKVI